MLFDAYISKSMRFMNKEIKKINKNLVVTIHPTGSLRANYAKGDGVFYKNTIKSGIELLGSCMEHTEIAVNKLTQSGATPVQVLSAVFFPVIYKLIKGKDILSLILIPGDDQTVDGFEKKVMGFFDFLSCCTISYKGKQINVGEHFRELRHKIASRLRRMSDSWFVFTPRKNYISAIQICKDFCVENNYGVAVFIDESHCRTKKDSILSKMYDVIYRDKKLATTVLVVTSATNWCYLKLPKIVDILIGDGYVGANIHPEHFGYYADPSTVIEPDFIDFANLSSKIGVDLESLAYLRSEKKFEKSDIACSFNQFIQDSANKFALAVPEIFQMVPDAMGMLMRCSDNGITRAFSRQLKHKLGNDVKVIDWYDKLDNNDLSEVIKQEVGKGQRYIILVTARGRQSDTFPDDCLIGISLTEKSGDLRALWQDIVGRMSGYRGKTLIIQSTINTNIMLDLMENRNNPDVEERKRFASEICNLDTRNVLKRKRQEREFSPLIECDDPIVKRLQTVLNTPLVNGEFIDKFSVSMSEKINITKIVPESEFVRLEKKYNIKLLRFSDSVYTNKINNHIPRLSLRTGSLTSHFGGIDDGCVIVRVKDGKKKIEPLNIIGLKFIQCPDYNLDGSKKSTYELKKNTKPHEITHKE